MCIRGYWDPPEDISKYAMIEWFKSQMQEAGIVDLREDLYFPTFSGKCHSQAQQNARAYFYV